MFSYFILNEMLFLMKTIDCYVRSVLNMKGAKLYQLSSFTTGLILKGKRDKITWQGKGKVRATT